MYVMTLSNLVVVSRSQWVLTNHPGQFSSRRGVCRPEHWAPVYSRRLPQPHCALAERRPSPAFRRPLDTAFDGTDHQRPEAGGQRQLRVRGHQQLWLKRGVWTASRYRCVSPYVCETGWHTPTRPSRWSKLADRESQTPFFALALRHTYKLHLVCQWQTCMWAVWCPVTSALKKEDRAVIHWDWILNTAASTSHHQGGGVWEWQR